MGIAASLLGFSPVLMTDLESVQSQVQSNILSSRASKLDVRFATLDWNSMASEQAEQIAGQHWDVILLADPVYSEKQVTALSQALGSILQSSHHAEILLAYADRHEAVTASLFAMLTKLNLAWQLVATSQLDRRVKIYIIKHTCCTDLSCHRRQLEQD